MSSSEGITLICYRGLLVLGASEEKRGHKDYQEWKDLQGRKEWQGRRV